jgi:hypothetical protein
MLKADPYGGASLLVIMIDVSTINLSINYMHHDFLTKNTLWFARTQLLKVSLDCKAFLGPVVDLQ